MGHEFYAACTSFGLRVHWYLLFYSLSRVRVMSDRLNLAGHVRIRWSACSREYGISGKELRSISLFYKMRSTYFTYHYFILSLRLNRTREASEKKKEKTGGLSFVHESLSQTKN